MPALSPLVVHHGAIGDTIQLTAALEALNRRWGAPCDLVTGREPAAPVVAGLPAVRSIRAIPSRSHPYWLSASQRSLVRWLAGRPPSPCYVIERWRHRRVPWSEATRAEWLLRRGGIPRERILTSADCGRGPLEHRVDYLLRLARTDPPGFAPAEIEDCRRWLGGRGWSGEPVVVLQALARRRKRGRWPDERWIAVARGILERLPGAHLLFAGAATEVAEAARLAAAAGDPRVSSVAGELPLRRLFALLTLAHSAVSLDSGPAHAAAALGCPVVVLAGTADPRRNRPRGGPGLVRVVDGFAGAWPESAEEWFRRHEVARIAPASVLAAWEELAPRRDPAS